MIFSYLFKSTFENGDIRRNTRNYVLIIGKAVLMVCTEYVVMKTKHTYLISSDKSG